MNQGDAAMWAAGMGIAGTLLGALGGAAVQGRNSRRQVADQERVDVRHWLREQRRVAYAAVLEQADAVTDALNPILRERWRPGWDDRADHSGLWAPANAALNALQRSVTTVAVAGPEEMEYNARAVHDCAMARANTARMPGVPADEGVIRFARASDALDAARERFVEAARGVLSGPDR